MSDIQTYLRQILDAVYGEEVRNSIHDAISTMNSDLESAIQDDLNPLAFKGNLGESGGTNNDLNNLIQTNQRGIWRLLGSHTYTNAPSDFDNGKQAYLIMYAFGTTGQTANVIKQEIHYFSDSGANANAGWSRVYISGEWQEWHRNVDATLSLEGAAADAKAVGTLKDEMHSNVDYLKGYGLERNPDEKNLFDYLSVIKGYLYYANSGAKLVGDTYWTTDFIPASEFTSKTYYTINISNSHVCYWNENKSFISGRASTANPASIYVGDGVAYVTVGSSNALTENIQLEKGTTGTAYSPYWIPKKYTELKQAISDDQGIVIPSINLRNEMHSNVDYLKGYGLERNPDEKNLFDYLSVIKGYLYYANSGAKLVGDTYWTTDFIPASEFTSKTYYTINISNSHVCYWNENKSFISGRASTANPASIYVGDGVAYVTVGSSNALTENIQLEKGTTGTAYSPYWIPKKDSKLKGKKIAFIGDSITFGVGASDYNSNPDLISKSYVNRFKSITGANVYNHGHSGYTLASNQKSGIGSMVSNTVNGGEVSENPDIIVVFGGTNDYWLGDIPIGSFSDGTSYTFYGALKWLCNYFSNNSVAPSNKSVRIVFVTPYQQYTQNSEGKIADPNDTFATGWNSCCDFGQGTLKGFRDAIIDVGTEYGCPVLDLYKLIPSMAKMNQPRYYLGASYADCVHPNDTLHDIIANLLSDFLEENI